MFRLKDICAAMDGCHERTAKRWWKKLDEECVSARLPRVRPDVRGHGAHKWKPATFRRLIKMWGKIYSARGTTPQIVRAKYAGKNFQERQIFFPLQYQFNFNDSKKIQETSVAKARRPQTGKERAAAAR